MARTQIIKKNISLDDLPKEKYGNILRIIWGKSVGYKVYFIYDDIRKKDNYYMLNIKIKNMI